MERRVTPRSTVETWPQRRGPGTWASSPKARDQDRMKVTAEEEHSSGAPQHEEGKSNPAEP
eukprot:3924053-Pyramimonas_sp.AAC.1